MLNSCLLSKTLNKYFLKRTFKAVVICNLQDRMWRKTRSHSDTRKGSCVGADPNRNFPTGWQLSKLQEKLILLICYIGTISFYFKHNKFLFLLKTIVKA